MKKQTAKEEPQPTKFDFFKAEILKRAKDANACAEQYKRAYASVSFAELFTVIKDNFNYACNNKIVDFELLTTVKDEARESEIFVNESTKIGYLFAWGNATVKAGGNAFISSYKTVECKLAAHAISRNTTTNEITIVDGAYTIKTVKI